MLFAAFSILTAVTILLGVRHEPRVRAWAMSPRTPARVAGVITYSIHSVWWAASRATVISLGGVGGAYLIAVLTLPAGVA